MIPIPHLVTVRMSDIEREARLIQDAPLWVNITLAALGRMTTVGHARILRPFLPYILHKTSNPDAYCVVHRGYHAIGTTTWTDYEAARDWHVTRAWYEHCQRENIVGRSGELFDDSDSPWQSGTDMKSYKKRVLALIAPWLEAQ